MEATKPPHTMSAKKAATKSTTKKAAAKKATAKKAVKKTPVAKKTTAKKTAAKKAATAKKAPPTTEAIAQQAYINYLHRVENGLPGDSHGDWIDAVKMLGGK